MAPDIKGRPRARNKKKCSAAARFFNSQLESMVEDNERYEKYKETHKEFFEMTSALEMEMLDRTVVITHLNESVNKQDIRAFLCREYGPVERIHLRERKLGGDRTHPVAQVTFKDKRPAEAMMNNKSLSDIRNSSKKVRSTPTLVRVANCPFAYRGQIAVNAAEKHDSNVEFDEKKEFISFTATKLSLGQWLTPEMLSSDPLKFPEQSGKTAGNGASNTKQSVFLKEYSINTSFAVKFKIRERTLNIIADESSVVVDAQTREARRYKLVTKWKNIQGYVALTFDRSGEDQGYSLRLRLVNPPRIYMSKKYADLLLTSKKWTNEARATSFYDAPIGLCLGFRLHIDPPTASQLIGHSALGKCLSKFGIFEVDHHCMVKPSITSTQIISLDGRSGLQRGLVKIKDRKLGFLARAVIDSGIAYWYHFVHDKVDTPSGKMTFLDLVNAGSSNVVQKVRNCRHEPSRNRCNDALLFASFHNAFSVFWLITTFVSSRFLL